MAGYNPYAGSSSTYNPYAGTGTKGAAHGAHGVGGVFQNLGSDIKGAVEGFIPGVVHLAEHPIGGTEAVAKGIWSTWSPLLHGQFTKFGQGVYDHPLAPLLDLAAIASGGLGAAGKLGELGMSADALATERAAIAAGESLDPASNIFHAAARLKMPKTQRIFDKSISQGGQGRGFVDARYSTRPLRRLVQEQVNPRILGQLPQHWQDALMQSKFNRMLHGEMARRATAAKVASGAFRDAAAKADATAAARAGHLGIADAAMLVGHSILNPATSQRVLQELAAGMHMNLAQNAVLRMTPEDAIAFAKEHPHFRAVKAMSAMDSSYVPRLTSLRSQEAKLQRTALKHAPLAYALPRIQEELAHHNAQLQEMYDKGYLHTQTPAVNAKGDAVRTPTTRQSMEQHAQPVLEAQRNVKMLTRLQDKAHTAKAAHDDAVAKLADIKAQRMDLERRSHAEYYSHVSSSVDAFNHYAENFGRHAVVRITPKNVNKMWIGMDGKVPLVPHHDATMLGRTARADTGFVTKMARNATGFWKGIQVKFTPKTVLNNTLGNHIIYAFRSMDPMTAFRSMYHAVRLSHGKTEADQILMRATPWRNKSWLFQNFTPELHNTFGTGTLAEGTDKSKLSQSTSRISRVLRGPGMYTLVQKLADEPTRLGAITAYVHSDPQVIARADELMAKAKARGASISRTEALDQAAGRVIRRNPDLRARAADYGRSVAGDYLNLTQKEQKLKDWVPFYLWDRHILKSGSNLLKDTPGRAVMLQQLSQMGEAETHKYLGNVPEFLSGALPLKELGLSGGSGGRVNALVAPSLNPWGTLGEIAGLAQAATVGGDKQTGSDLFSQLNPLLTAGIQYGTGTSLLTGAPVKRNGGLLTSVLSQIGQGFPESKVVASAVNPPVTQTASGKPKLYSQNELAAISNFLGVPIKQISPQAAAAQYKTEQQQGTSTKKKKQYNPYG